MRCERSRQIDLDAFLLDFRDAEQAAFREHYPGCPDCSAAVGRWSAIDLAIRSLPDEERASWVSGHPDPGRLEQWVDSPERLGKEGAMIERHLDACDPCRTEVMLIRRFDPVALAAAAASSSAVSSGARAVDRAEEAGPFESIRRFFESLTIGFSPAAVGAFAIVLIAVVGLLLGGLLPIGSDGVIGTGSIDGPQIAEQPGPRTGGPDFGMPVVPAPPRDLQDDDRERTADQVDRLALEPDGTTRAPDLVEARSNRAPESVDLSTKTRLADASSAVRTDGARVQPAQVEPAVVPGSDPERDAVVGEEILLAALTELPMPTYGAPPGAGSVGWLRDFGAVRGRNDAIIVSQAPDHVGLTLSSAPRLWWSLDRSTALPIQVTVVDEEAIDPIVRIDLPGPHAAGLHSFSLADRGIELERDVEYRWHVTLMVDPDRPSRNPVSGGAIRVVSAGDARYAEANPANAAERGHVLARLGIWYDAYDFFAGLSEAHPEIASIARYRDSMMRLARDHADPIDPR